MEKDNKQLIIILMFFGFFYCVFMATVLLSERISTDLTLDMAKKGYIQKEINGKVLWTKEDKGNW